MLQAASVSKAMSSHGAVVLAAGKGTRMKSQTPKVLHRICGREMVSLVVDAACEAGFDPIVVVAPRDSQAIKDTLGSRVRYAQQAQPLGSGHAMLQARSVLDHMENVFVLVGDVPLILPETLSEMRRLHDDREACITLLTAVDVNPNGLGRVVRSGSGSITAVIEEGDADEAALSIAEVNAGVYCFRSHWLWDSLSSLPPSPGGEVFLTDLIGLAAQQSMLLESLQSRHPQETLGVNTRVQLAEAEAVMRQRIRERWMLLGVTMPDPAAVYIEAAAELGQDTVVLPNTHIIGASRIGGNCQIGPNVIVRDSLMGDGCRIVASVIDGSTLDDDVDVGPFSHIRPGSHLERGVRIGTSVEVKNSRLGPGTVSGHFSYIGDADLGANVNIGAGTITCNYDGEKKNKTTIGDDAFIGSDSMLVAPVNIGARSWTGAGAVVTRDVPPDSLAVGVPARVTPKKRGRKANK